MVKWTSGGSERTFNQSAANGRNEPKATDAARYTNVRFEFGPETGNRRLYQSATSNLFCNLSDMRFSGPVHCICVQFNT